MRPVIVVWRERVRDSELDSTAKHVAHVIASFMNRAGNCAIGKPRLARGCSLSTRAVDQAVQRLEAAGFLAVVRGVGGNPKTSTNSYQVLTPERASGVCPSCGVGDGRHATDCEALTGAPDAGVALHDDHSALHLTTVSPAARAPVLEEQEQQDARTRARLDLEQSKAQ